MCITANDLQKAQVLMKWLRRGTLIDEPDFLSDDPEHSDPQKVKGPDSGKEPAA